MSTYLDNAPTYLPTVQPYEPNFQLYAGTLEMKQTQFDTAHKQLSNLYGSLLNSPMLRDANINTRDEFFKTIDYEIKKVATLDLSLRENQSQATRLFTALYDDKNLVKDMMWTKNLYGEKERGENFRYCTDPEACGGEYWDEGIAALDYRAQEFRKMGNDEAMNFGDVKYSPYINIMKKAGEIAKAHGLDPISIDTVGTGADTGWLITTTNGPELLAGPLLQLFSQEMENDPRIKDMYRTKAYVERKSFVSASAQQYGSEEAAEQAWIQNKQNMVNSIASAMSDNLENTKDIETGKKEKLEEKIKSEGSTGDDDLALAYMESLKRDAQIDSTTKLIDGTLYASSKASDAKSISAAAEAMDGAYATILFSGDIERAAVTESYKNFSISRKADPLYLARLAASSKKKEEEEEEEAEKEFWDFGMAVSDPTPGATVVNTSETAAADYIAKEVKRKETPVKSSAAEINNELYRITKLDANSGAGQSSTELINQTTALIQNYKDWADVKGSAGDKRDAFKKIKSWSHMSDKQKLDWAKKENSFEYIIPKLGEQYQQKVYNKGFKSTVDAVSNKNQNFDYAKRHVIGLYPNIGYVQNSKPLLQSWRDVANAEAITSANKMKLTLGDSPIADFVTHAVGNNGYRNSNQTALSYANDAATKWKATDREQVDILSRFTPTLPESLRPEVVTKEGTFKRGSMQRDFTRAINEASKTQGTQMLEQIPNVEIKVGKGIKVIPVSEFFDEDGVAEEYDRYSNNFTWGKNKGSEEFEWNFRKAKWAYTFGDKSDAWKKDDNGEWLPDPYKEKSTWIGRNAIRVGAITGTFYSKSLFSTATEGAEYFNNHTDFNSKYDTYYGQAGYESKNKSALQREIEIGVADVDGTDSKSFGQILKGVGSMSAFAISGNLDFSMGMDNQQNRAFKEFYQASTKNGIGTSTGFSWVRYGMNQDLVDGEKNTSTYHDEKAMGAFLQMIKLATQQKTKDKGQLTLSYTYSAVAAGDDEVESMTIRPVFAGDVGETYVDRFVATLTGLKPDSAEFKKAKSEIMLEGITLYQPDAAARSVNQGGHYLYKTAKTNDLEKLMAITSELTVPGYDDISDVKVTSDGSYYNINASVQYGWDHDNNKPVFEERALQQFPVDTPLKYIYDMHEFRHDDGTLVKGLTGYLEYQRHLLKEAGLYKSSERSDDPSYIRRQWQERMTTTPQVAKEKQSVWSMNLPIFGAAGLVTSGSPTLGMIESKGRSSTRKSLYE